MAFSAQTPFARCVVLTLCVAAVLSLVVLLFAAEIAAALEPLAVRFDGDGTLDAENRAVLTKLVSTLGGGLLLAAAAGGAWLMTWSVAVSRLQARAAGAPSVPPPVTLTDVLIVLAAMATLTVLSARHLGRGLDFDEIATIKHVVLAPTWWDVFTRTVVFNNHIPFSALSRLSGWMFGAGEAAFRLPALVLGVAALPVTWFMARHWLGPAVAHAAVWLLAVAPLMVQYSASARGYTGLLLFGTLSTRLFLRSLEEPSRRYLVGSALALALSTWFHLYGVFIAGGQALTLAWLLWRRPAELSQAACRGVLQALVGAGALTAMLYLPVAPRLLLEIARRGRGTFQPEFPLVMALELSGGSILVALLSAVGLWQLARGGWRGGVLPAITVGTTVLTMWVVHPRDLYVRFFMFLLPLAVIAIAAAVVGWPAAGRLQRGAGWLVVAIVLVWGTRSNTSVPEEGYRSAALAVRAARSDGQVAIGIGVGSGLVDYYLGHPVPVADTLEDFRTLAGSAREVVVVHRRGVHEQVVHPVKLYLDEEAHSVTHFANMSVYVLRR